MGLRTGDNYDQVTEKALRAAKAVVVLWSKHSVESRWVRAEATLADRNKTLVPVMIEPCDRPIMFELTQTAELAHWQGNTNDQAWAAFLGDVQRFMGQAAAPSLEVSADTLSAPTVEETLKPGQSGSAPSLAVLPFTNRSGLADDDVFAEAFVEDVISALSQGVNVRVLGSTATANLNRKAVTDLAAVGRRLGVQYLLEGNVRRSGANLRVTTQLLEAATGEVIGTARFDRPLAELAELQEELVTEVAASLDSEVFTVEMERALRKPRDITAWEAIARSTSAYRNFNAASLQLAIKEARRAVAIAPDYAFGHAQLATTLALNFNFARCDDPGEVARIRAIVERALELAPEDATVLSLAGNALCCIHDPEEGIRYTGKAVRKAPGSGVLQYFYGVSCVMLNRPQEALSHFASALRLAPGWHVTWAVKYFQAFAYRELNHLAEADAAIDECIELLPTLADGHVLKALIGAAVGQDDLARRHIETAWRLGLDVAATEWGWRANRPHSPRLEADLALIRSLYAATDPAA